MTREEIREEQLDDIAEKLEQHLNDNCSGSGIDAGFELEGVTAKYIRIKSSYHTMNEHGYYDGWQDFTLLIPTTIIDGFVASAGWKLQFNGGQRLANKYQLREYLEDTLHYCLEQYFAD